MKIIISIGVFLALIYLFIGLVVTLVLKTGGLEREVDLPLKTTLLKWPQVLGLIPEE